MIRLTISSVFLESCLVVAFLSLATLYSKLFLSFSKLVSIFLFKSVAVVASLLSNLAMSCCSFRLKVLLCCYSSECSLVLRVERVELMLLVHS